jgi:hypothetical protein
VTGSAAAATAAPSAAAVAASRAAAGLSGPQVFGGGFNGAVAVSSDGTHVWVANSGANGSVTELDAATGAFVRVISGYGKAPTGISSDGTHVWVANEGSNSVTELDAATGALVRVTTGSPYITSPLASNYQSTNLSLQVIGTSSGGHPLTWSATGLPPGLTIGSSSGLISGQITASPGSYRVTVSAADATGAHSSVSFGWQIKADAGSVVTNKGSSLCLNDYQSKITPGNEVVMWKCNTAGNEKFSHPANAGELIVFGQCLSDPAGHGGAGAIQQIQPCTASSSQEWYKNSTGEFVLQKNNLCLTDPNNSTVNGTPVEIETCTNASDQHWLGS